MAKFKVPVTWMMSGFLTIEADDRDHAYELAMTCDVPDDGDYIRDSLGPVHKEYIEEEVPHV